MFFSSQKSNAQSPLFYNYINIASGLSFFSSTAPEYTKHTNYGFTVNAILGSPLITGLIGNDQALINIGDFLYIGDSWTLDAGFGMTYPSFILINGHLEYGAGFKFGRSYKGFSLFFGDRVFFSSVGPGQRSPVLGIGLFGLHLKLGAGFVDASYIWSNKREPDKYIAFGIKSYDVKPGSLKFSSIGGTIGQQLSFCVSFNY